MSDLGQALVALGAGDSLQQSIIVITGIAPSLSAVIAAAAFVFAIVKQRQDANLQRELEADRRWTSFMDLAFENPEFAYRPDFCWRCKGSPRSERPIEDVKHKNFVSRFLFTAEEVLEISNDDAWRTAVSSQLSCHEHYFLQEMTAHQIASYSIELQKVITDWQSEANRRRLTVAAQAKGEAGRDEIEAPNAPSVRQEAAK